MVLDKNYQIVGVCIIAGCIVLFLISGMPLGGIYSSKAYIEAKESRDKYDSMRGLVQEKFAEAAELKNTAHQERQNAREIATMYEEKLNNLEDAYQNKWTDLNVMHQRREDKLEAKEKQVEFLQKQIEGMKKDMQIALANAKKLKADADNTLKDAEDKQNKIIKEANAIKKDAVDIQEQAEVKLKGAKLQEKLNLDFRNKALANLLEASLILDKNIEAYKRAEGGFIDIFQNRLPNNIKALEKTLDACNKIDNVFANDAELIASLAKAKDLIKEGKKRVPGLR